MQSAHHKEVTKYRPEVDGLRALAVIPVILFHAGSEIFAGGFIGVDIFFVISGYLITLILVNDIEKGRFSLVTFYERRARRILPALALVSLLCIPPAWYWMTPGELEHFGGSLAALALFGSNIYFWLTTGYFTPGADELPLLHTWSLGVEEQFYLIFPLLLMAIWRYGPVRTWRVLLTLLLGSLLLAEWGWRHSEVANYFLLPTRAWELLVGSLLALQQVRRMAGAAPEDGGRGGSYALLGLLLLAGSILYFDSGLPHPSLLTLIPIVGVALVIRFASPGNLAGRLLSARPLVALGLVSYSAYLIHQPLFVFARLSLLEPPGPLMMAGLSLLVIPLAWMSWRFVETPFRSGSQAGKGTLRLAALSLCLIALAGVALRFHNGGEVAQRLPASLLATMQRIEGQCFNKPGAHERLAWLCSINPRPAQTPDFLLLGDSHMNSILSVMEYWSRRNGYSGQYAGYLGCPPLLGIYPIRPDQAEKDCHALNLRVLEHVRASGIRNIVLSSRWSYYTDGGYLGQDFCYLGSRPGQARNRDASRAAFEKGVRETVATYAALGVKVHVLLQVPQQLYPPGKVYSLAQTEQGIPDVDVLRGSSVLLQKHESLQRYTHAVFRAVQKEFPHHLALIDPAATLCDVERCLIGNSQQAYYYDDDHVSVPGALRLGPQFDRELRMHLGEGPNLVGRH